MVNENTWYSGNDAKIISSCPSSSYALRIKRIDLQQIGNHIAMTEFCRAFAVPVVPPVYWINTIFDNVRFGRW